MNRKIILLVYLLSIFGLANAQGSKEDFEKAVDYCACKIAYAYTNQYAEKNSNSVEGKSFEETIKPKIENCEINDPISNSELSELLSENNFGTFSKEFIPVINLVQDAFQDALTQKEVINVIVDGFYNNSDFKTIITTYTDIGSLENDLKKELNNSLNSFNVKVIQSTNLKNSTGTEWKSEINRLENSINNEKPFLPNWLSTSLILSAFIFSLFSLYLLMNDYKRLDRHRDELERLKSNNFNSINSRNTNNSQFERTTNRKILDLNDAIGKLQKENSNTQVSQQNQISQTKHIHQSSQKEIQNFVYAKTPIDEKTFNAFDVSEEKEGKFYKFIITNNKNQAKFEFFNTENSAKRAVNSPDNFLYLVCDEIEPLNQNAKKIITKKAGIAIKQDGKWIVTEKAKITYE